MIIIVLKFTEISYIIRNHSQSSIILNLEQIIHISKKCYQINLIHKQYCKVIVKLDEALLYHGHEESYQLHSISL